MRERFVKKCKRDEHQEARLQSQAMHDHSATPKTEEERQATGKLIVIPQTKQYLFGEDADARKAKEARGNSYQTIIQDFAPPGPATLALS